MKLSYPRFTWRTTNTEIKILKYLAAEQKLSASEILSDALLLYTCTNPRWNDYLQELKSTRQKQSHDSQIVS